MMVTVQLFAAVRDAVGDATIALEFDQPPTVRQVRARLVELHPQVGSLLSHCLFALNEDYAGDEDVVGEGISVACIPPVSGG